MSDEDLILGEEEGELLLLERQCEVCLDDIGPHVVGVVFCHQTRRHVNADNLGGAGVDVFHQRCETASQWFVQAGTEQTIYHQHILFQKGRLKLLNNLNQGLRTFFLQALFVDGTVLREMAGYVEEVGCHIVIPVDEHSGNSQCITAVIARSGKDDDGRRAAPMVGNGLGQRLSCPLHQIDGFYGFMLNGIFVQLMYLSTRKYLHRCKNTKNMLTNSRVWQIFCNFAEIFNLFSV